MKRLMRCADRACFGWETHASAAQRPAGSGGLCSIPPYGMYVGATCHSDKNDMRHYGMYLVVVVDGENPRFYRYRYIQP